jgi:hypothetical protein
MWIAVAWNSRPQRMIGASMGKGKVIYRGPLKSDAPEYREDWSVHIGPLYGSCSKKPSENTLQKNSDNSERGPDPAQPAGTRRAKKQASIRKPV